MVRVVHNKCGKLAFYVKEKLKSGDVLVANNVLSIDRNPMKPGDTIICGSCHMPMRMSTLEITQESWKDWFIVDEL